MSTSKEINDLLKTAVLKQRKNEKVNSVELARDITKLLIDSGQWEWESEFYVHVNVNPERKRGWAWEKKHDFVTDYPTTYTVEISENKVC